MSANADLPSVNEADANEADVVEQSEDVAEVESVLPASESVEVDEFDAAEQGRAVELDPDEYR